MDSMKEPVGGNGGFPLIGCLTGDCTDICGVN